MELSDMKLSLLFNLFLLLKLIAVTLQLHCSYSAVLTKGKFGQLHACQLIDIL